MVGEDVKRIRLAVIPAEKDADGKRPLRRLTSGDPSVGNVEGPGHFDWSPDGKWIAFDHQPTAHVDDWPKGDISLVEVESGAVRPLAATAGAESNPSFSPDGRWVAYEAGGRARAVGGRVAHPRRARWRGERRARWPPTFDERPDLLGWTADGTRVLVSGDARHRRAGSTALPVDGGAGADITPADSTVDDGGAQRVAHARSGSRRRLPTARRRRSSPTCPSAGGRPPPRAQEADARRGAARPGHPCRSATRRTCRRSRSGGRRS